MEFIEKNRRDLSERIVAVSTRCNNKRYPTEYETYDEAWQNVFLSLGYLKKKLGEDLYCQLTDMVMQSKIHYENEMATGDFEELRLGSFLMQDIEWLLKGKEPFSYPVDMYRWPRGDISRKKDG